MVLPKLTSHYHLLLSFLPLSKMTFSFPNRERSTSRRLARVFPLQVYILRHVL